MNKHEVDILVEKGREQDAESLVAICEYFYPQVLKYMRYRVDLASAEDLTSEVFLRVLRHIGGQKGSFQAWLYKISANVVVDHCRTRKMRKEIPMSEEIIESVEAGKDPSGAMGSQIDISHAISKLTDEQRELITLKFIQGLSNSDIAEITSRSQEAIRGLQYRALSSLRDIFGGEK